MFLNFIIISKAQLKYALASWERHDQVSHNFPTCEKMHKVKKLESVIIFYNIFAIWPLKDALAIYLYYIPASIHKIFVDKQLVPFNIFTTYLSHTFEFAVTASDLKVHSPT